VDTPERDQLMAARHNVEEMARLINVDSLAFISVDGLYRAAGQAQGRDNNTPAFCDACFTGEYPVDLTDRNAGHGIGQKETFTGMSEVKK